VRKAAGAVFLLTLPALIPFWAVEGTQPAGSVVLWILYGVLVASGTGYVLTYRGQMIRAWQRFRTRPHRSTATAGRANVLPAGTHAKPEPFDPELHVLLSHGRGIKDDYLLGGGLPSINKAQRDESHRWTRDTASVLKARDPALAKRFLAAQSHRARLSVLADILGVDEP
jgi:hypothetical protein